MSNKIRFQGTKIESVTPQYGQSQIINEHTHIIENLSFCIDRIFTLPNLELVLVVHSSFNKNYPDLEVYYPPTILTTYLAL